MRYSRRPTNPVTCTTHELLQRAVKALVNESFVETTRPLFYSYTFFQSSEEVLLIFPSAVQCQ
jgi:hypothetical protein